MPTSTDVPAMVPACFVGNSRNVGTQTATFVANDNEERDSGTSPYNQNEAEEPGLFHSYREQTRAVMRYLVEDGYPPDHPFVAAYNDHLFMTTAHAEQQRVLEQMPTSTDVPAILPACFVGDDLLYSPNVETQTATSLANDYEERDSGTSPYNQKEAIEHGLLADVPAMAPATFVEDDLYYSPLMGTPTATSVANDNEEHDSGTSPYNQKEAIEHGLLADVPAMAPATFVEDDLYYSPLMGTPTATSVANDNEEHDSGTSPYNQKEAIEHGLLADVPAMAPATFLEDDLYYSPLMGMPTATSVANDNEEHDSGVIKTYHTLTSVFERRVLEQMPALTDELSLVPACFVRNDLHYSPYMGTQTATSLANDYGERDSG